MTIMPPIHTLFPPPGKITLFLCTVMLLSGCAEIVNVAYTSGFRLKIEDASTLTEEEKKQFKQVRFIESAEALNTKSMGDVTGHSCKLDVQGWWLPELNDLNGQTPEQAARTQLQIMAMRKGANAVVTPKCTHKDGIDWVNNCFDSWVCIGRAVLLP